MIRIELDDNALARTRIAVSPLWEALGSLFLLARNADPLPWPYEEWGRKARAITAAVPADSPLQIFLGNRVASPDFLAPAPSTPSPTLEEQLAVIRATPAEVIAAQLP